MRVKNLNGSTQLTCVTGSWLTYWEKMSGQTAQGCFVTGCRNKRSVGGKVQRDSPTDRNWYIVPLCEDCNKNTGHDLDIWDFAKLVPANMTRIMRVVPDAPRMAGHRTASDLS